MSQLLLFLFIEGFPYSKSIKTSLMIGISFLEKERQRGLANNFWRGPKRRGEQKHKKNWNLAEPSFCQLVVLGNWT